MNRKERKNERRMVALKQRQKDLHDAENYWRDARSLTDEENRNLQQQTIKRIRTEILNIERNLAYS